MDYSKCVATISRGVRKGERCQKKGDYRLEGFPASSRFKTCGEHRISWRDFYAGGTAPAWLRQMVEKTIRMRYE